MVADRPDMCKPSLHSLSLGGALAASANAKFVSSHCERENLFSSLWIGSGRFRNMSASDCSPTRILRVYTGARYSTDRTGLEGQRTVVPAEYRAAARRFPEFPHPAPLSPAPPTSCHVRRAESPLATEFSCAPSDPSRWDSGQHPPLPRNSAALFAAGCPRRARPTTAPAPG